MSIFNWLFGPNSAFGKLFGSKPAPAPVPAPVPVPVPVTTRGVGFVVFGPKAPLTGVNIALDFPGTAHYERVTNADGYAVCDVLTTLTAAVLTVNANGFAPYSATINIPVRNVDLMMVPPGLGIRDDQMRLDPLVPLAPPVVLPDELYVDGPIFRKKKDNTAWRYKLVSNFYAIQRWDRGEDLSGWLAWTKQVGGNGWRVFCQFKLGNPSDPCPPTQLSPARIAQFVDWAYQQGLYIELTVLTDTQAEGFNMSLADKVARVRDVLAAVAHKPNVFVEIMNEPFKNGDGVKDICDALGLRTKSNRPCLMATGNYDIVGQEDTFFGLDYVGDHPERKDAWSGEAGKTGHFVYDGWAAASAENGKGWAGFHGQNVAIISDEPIGAAEIPVPGRREANRNHWEEAGGGFGIGASGGCGHTDAGSGWDSVTSSAIGNRPLQVPGPVQTQCITAFFAAMDFFPADTFAGQYTHDGLSNHPLVSVAPAPVAVEIAARICGGKAYAVAAMPTAAWAAVAVPGWTITKQAGWSNELVQLSR
jgi:hypothetical protein